MYDNYEPRLWDDALEDYIQYMYEHGMSKEKASRTVYGIAWAFPMWKHGVMGALPLARACLSGWGKLEPGTSRPPVPFEVAYAIALECLRHGRATSGLAVLLMFECYFRVSELLHLRARQVFPGVNRARGSAAHTMLVINPRDLGISSKTGEFDSSVPLDLARHQWFANVLLMYVGHLDNFANPLLLGMGY